MTTFHYKTDIQTTQALMNNLELKACEHNNEFLSELQQIVTSNNMAYSNVFGFAIKLSRLTTYNLELHDLLDITSNQIIIDAETKRLDHFLLDKLESGLIAMSQLHRLAITIQVKRKDAEEQLLNLRELQSSGLKIVLVAGNAAYFKGVELTNKSTSTRFIEMSKLADIFLYGIDAKMKERLENKKFSIKQSQILELQGYQQIGGSALWTYYAGEHLSQEARDYLSRRKTSGYFLVREFSELAELAKDHDLYLFLDRCCSLHYVLTLLIMDQYITSHKG